MKRSYEKPVLTRREQLAAITANGDNKISPFFKEKNDYPEAPAAD